MREMLRNKLEKKGKKKPRRFGLGFLIRQNLSKLNLIIKNCLWQQRFVLER